MRTANVLTIGSGALCSLCSPLDAEPAAAKQKSEPVNHEIIGNFVINDPSCIEINREYKDKYNAGEEFGKGEIGFNISYILNFSPMNIGLGFGYNGGQTAKISETVSGKAKEGVLSSSSRELSLIVETELRKEKEFEIGVGADPVLTFLSIEKEIGINKEIAKSFEGGVLFKIYARVYKGENTMVKSENMLVNVEVGYRLSSKNMSGILFRVGLGYTFKSGDSTPNMSRRN